ncbi:MAG: hypothetical protein RI897_4224 [Verrucomicrobiota bacterium]
MVGFRHPADFRHPDRDILAVAGASRMVEATEARQRIWLVDPFGLPEGEKPEEEGRAARFDEAALVAQHGGVPVAGGGVEEDEPVMRDIFLVRALALLKGLERVRGGILR